MYNARIELFFFYKRIIENIDMCLIDIKEIGIEMNKNENC